MSKSYVYRVSLLLEQAAVIPIALMFSRYRSFLEPVRVELAPLTIIIGKNGSGKSVLTRLPLLIASGLSPSANSVLDLSAGGVSHAARFEDLIHQRSAQPFSLGAEISDGRRSLSFLTTMRYVVERHALGIESFTLSDQDGLIVSIEASRPEDIGNTEGLFAVKSRGVEASSTSGVRFVGLFADSIGGNDDLGYRLSEVRKEFAAAFDSPCYLGPFRSEQGSSARVANQGVRGLGPKGEYAIDLLGADALAGNGNLGRAVEEWFGRAMTGNSVKLEQIGSFVRMLVHDPIRNIDVDMSETGAGFAQVFPIAVQALGMQTGAVSTSISIVEQPELHLHPGAHGELADLIVSSAARCYARSRYLCETHSEQFITRVRLGIAQGRIAHTAVRIVSVGHLSERDGVIEPIRTIEIDAEGNMDAWPVGVFDEAFDDLLRLQSVQRGERADEGRA
ncbi:AAA family ATPase [Paraburkholderia tropica]|uniref:AAA family ATPase n=1 Tax=Paraburkholderia tropica TaxID=92647 RepID=UPI002AB7C879|nr:DUF3696 domain-containing protein [Paraburkholderia tropica]